MDRSDTERKERGTKRPSWQIGNDSKVDDGRGMTTARVGTGRAQSTGRIRDRCRRARAAPACHAAQSSRRVAVPAQCRLVRDLGRGGNDRGHMTGSASTSACGVRRRRSRLFDQASDMSFVCERCKQASSSLTRKTTAH